MPGRKAFALRISPEIYDAVRKWADDDLRSVNGQIEFLLARALKEAKRYPKAKVRYKPPNESSADKDPGEEA